MGIISEAKSTYRFARGELAKDIKRNPTARKYYAKTKKTISTIRNPRKMELTRLKRGKTIPTKDVLSKLKKNVPKSKYQRAKYKKKPIKNIRQNLFSVGLNI